MEKILIMYYSKTGHTEEMAQSVTEGVKAEGLDVEVKLVQEAKVEDLLSADGIILGSSTYYGIMAGPLKNFIDESIKYHGKLAGKVGGAFATSGVLGGGNETTVLDIVKAFQDDTTADFTWALILATARRVVEADQYLRALRWKGWELMDFLGYDVHHKVLGICGLGRIGQGVARRAKGFDMQILYKDVIRADPWIEKELGARFVDKKTLLSESDFVTSHVPLSLQTTHYISKDEFALMKPTAILINASRGPVVDEKALVQALKEGRIAGAGLDVYEKEPEIEHELIQMKNVVLAPHIASASRETRLKMATMAAENLVAGLLGKRPPNLVNK